MAQKAVPGWNELQRIKAQVTHKIVTKLQMPHGPGETTGTQHHFIEVENVTLETVKSIFAGLPMSQPTFYRNKAGVQHQRNNWEGLLQHMPRVSDILDVGCSRLGAGRGEGASVTRVGGEALVIVAPPFLVEHVDNGQEICKLTIAFNSVVLNSWSVITWPPSPIFSAQEEYAQACCSPSPYLPYEHNCLCIRALANRARDARIPHSADSLTLTHTHLYPTQMEKFMWQQALEVYELCFDALSKSFKITLQARFANLLKSHSSPEKPRKRKSYESESF